MSSDKSGKESPAERYFLSRYCAAATIAEATTQRRDDLVGMSDGTIPKSRQDICDTVASHLRSLLLESETKCLGDFYFGLTAELLLSATIDAVENSHLVLIHRRLFNALSFLTDVLASFRMTDTQRWQMIAEYFRKVVSAGTTPTRFPSAPPFVVEQEVVFAGLLFPALLRFVLAHELSHILPATKIRDVDVERELACSAELVRKSWQRECQADIIGACLPLRELTLSGDLAQAYIQVTLSAPILFCFFMEAIERATSLANPRAEVRTDEYPPGALRARTLKQFYWRAFPECRDFVEENFSQTERNFHMILKRLGEGYK